MIDRIRDAARQVINKRLKGSSLLSLLFRMFRDGLTLEKPQRRPFSKESICHSTKDHGRFQPNQAFFGTGLIL